MYKLTLKPQDCLFFRDGKPFGSDASYADTVFPPYPSTFMGALRTLIITSLSDVHNFKDNTEITEIIGTFNNNEFIPSEKLKIKNIILTKENNKYFQAPEDLCYEEDNEDENNQKLSKFSWIQKDEIPAFFLENLEDIKEKESDFTHLLLNKSNKIIKSLGSRYLIENNFLKYLKGENFRNISEEREKFYYDEEHIKNSLDRSTKTTKQEGGIFSYNMKRIEKDVAFEVYFDRPEKIDNIETKGYIKLGGESRVAYYEIEKLTDENLLSFNDFNKNYKENDLLKIVVQTPLIVIDKFPKKIKKKFNILGIAVSGKIKIGGWDMIKKHPKPMYEAYAPGTIFLVKENNEIDEKKYNEILNTNFSDIKEKEGFGKIYLGIEKIEKTGGN